MEHVSLSALRQRHSASGLPYDEFLRVESLSAGLYVLEPDDVDNQVPHSEDEIYVVVSGRASFRGGDETVHIGPGSTIFVPAHEEHRFFDIIEKLELLVVFAPPESED